MLVNPRDYCCVMSVLRRFEGQFHSSKSAYPTNLRRRLHSYKLVALQGSLALIELPSVSKHQALKEQFLPFVLAPYTYACSVLNSLTLCQLQLVIISVMTTLPFSLEGILLIKNTNKLSSTRILLACVYTTKPKIICLLYLFNGKKYFVHLIFIVSHHRQKNFNVEFSQTTVRMYVCFG